MFLSLLLIFLTGYETVISWNRNQSLTLCSSFSSVTSFLKTASAIGERQMFPMETRDSSEFSDYWKQKSSNCVDFSAQIRLKIFIYSNRMQSPAPRLGQSPISVQTVAWRDWGAWCRDTGGWKVGYEPAECTCSPESQSYPWLYHKQQGQQVEGRDSTPQLSLDSSWTNAFSSGAPSTRKTWSCWSGSKGGPQRWPEGWAPLSENWGCAVWRRKGLGRSDFTATFLYIKEAVVTMVLKRNRKHLYWT